MGIDRGFGRKETGGGIKRRAVCSRCYTHDGIYLLKKYVSHRIDGALALYTPFNKAQKG